MKHLKYEYNNEILKKFQMKGKAISFFENIMKLNFTKQIPLSLREFLSRNVLLKSVMQNCISILKTQKQ